MPSRGQTGGYRHWPFCAFTRLDWRVEALTILCLHWRVDALIDHFVPSWGQTGWWRHWHFCAFTRPDWRVEALTFCAFTRPDWRVDALCFLLVYLSVRSFVYYHIYQPCQHSILKMNESSLMQIGCVTYGAREWYEQLLGVRRLNVKVCPFQQDF